MGRAGYLLAVLAMSAAPLAVGTDVATAADDAVAFEEMELNIASGTPKNPTSLDWGPDGRLYVSDRLGTIRVYAVERTGSGYVTTSTELIGHVADIPNHNDDGSSSSEPDRQVTGITVVGTATTPVIYVSSSDPRIGGGTDDPEDTDLDTNSGTISRLTKSGSGWSHQILVRGLPRSEENHSTNGLQYDASENILYVAQGGHTNHGAPSTPFIELPEYALSAAILSIDLGALGSLPYDIPTLKGGTFGGEHGANQAKLVSGGPVQVYAPGFRNPYDLVLTESGEMYTVDNGGNQNWGNLPAGEGNNTTCTHQTMNGGPGVGDTLHRVTAGYYGGHPNPTRANPSMFSGAAPGSDSRQCNHISPGDPGSSPGSPAAGTGLVVFPQESINGITEYTATNFGGAMQGDLLTVNLQGQKTYRVQVEEGQDVNVGSDVSELFSQMAGVPLDIVAVGDEGPFPGTVWVTDLGSTSGTNEQGGILVYEPRDDICQDGLPPANSGDADGDGFSNADEYDNGTNPCSPASRPPDVDDDGVSDLNDPDDDNDGRPDTSDAFAIDGVTSGTPATVPFRLSWDGSSDIEGGLAGTGFTGLMVNGSDYLDLFDQGPMTIGGAAGLLTVPARSGDALGGRNSQTYAFQLGVRVPDDRFVIEARLPTPLESSGMEDGQSAGIYLGPGNQSDFVRVAAVASGGAGGVGAVREVADAVSEIGTRSVGLSSLAYIDLMLQVDPDSRTVTVFYAEPGGDPVRVGSSTTIPASWLSNPGGLAVGIIATSRGSGAEFGATYEHIEVYPDAGTILPPPEVSGAGGTFVDDDDSIFEDDIEWLAATGITRGCNPPDNDRFCPDDNVTRGQMAAFFVRALGLSDGAGADLFSDDDGSIFEGDIDRFGTEGITRGCNPPDNDRFCPDDNVTRGQMAAFFVRALGLSDGLGADLFSDDDGSIFEGDIDRFGTEGITRGCNPPDNDRYCPDDFVTRGQMAAFFHRTASLLGLSE